MVYILDQVRALEEELLHRIKQQGLAVKPQILVVSYLTKDYRKCFGESFLFHFLNFISQVTRLIPDARGTKCNQELEPIVDTNHSHILRVPFMTQNGVLRQWVSRFDIYPYLERFAQANISLSLAIFLNLFFQQKISHSSLLSFSFSSIGCYC